MQIVQSKRTVPKRGAKAGNGSALNANSSVVPVAVAYGNRVTKPASQIQPTAGGVRISNTEYVSEIFGSVNFNAVAQTIQPGNAVLFPWLSGIAYLYESYTFEKLSFHFKTEKSASTNGTILMAVDYDVTDLAPINKQQIMTYSGAVRTQPWANTTLSCPVSDLQKIKTRYVNTGIVLPNTDPKLYDVGKLFSCTQGCADTSPLGELYVEYVISLRTPQYDPAVFASIGSNYSTGSVGITAARLLGTTPTLNVAGSGMSIQYDVNTGVFTFPIPGSYLCIYTVATTNTTGGGLNLTMSGGSTFSGNDTAASTILMTSRWTIRILNAGDTMTTAGWIFTGPTAARISIASYPFGL